MSRSRSKSINGLGTERSGINTEIAAYVENRQVAQFVNVDRNFLEVVVADVKH